MRQISLFLVSVWEEELWLLFSNSKVSFFNSQLLTTLHYCCWNIVFLYRLIFFPSPGEAVGHLVCVLKQNSLRLSVQADKIVRSLWAQPSVGGAQVVATVLSNPAHIAEWWVTLHVNNLLFEECGLDGHIATVSVDVHFRWKDMQCFKQSNSWASNGNDKIHLWNAPFAHSICPVLLILNHIL